MRFGSTAKVLAECKLKYYRISQCIAHDLGITAWRLSARIWLRISRPMQAQAAAAEATSTGKGSKVLVKRLDGIDGKSLQVCHRRSG